MNVTETIQRIYDDDVDLIDRILRGEGTYSHKNTEGRGDILYRALMNLNWKVGSNHRLRSGGIEITLPEKEFETLQQGLDDWVSKSMGGAKAVLIHIALEDLRNYYIAYSATANPLVMGSLGMGRIVRNQNDMDREKLNRLRVEVKI